jgi:hypothetical protein
LIEDTFLSIEDCSQDEAGNQHSIDKPVWLAGEYPWCIAKESGKAKKGDHLVVLDEVIDFSHGIQSLPFS